MSKGAWIHDDVVRHFGSGRVAASCAQCHATEPEKSRVAQPKEHRRTVPDEVLAAMCPDGRAIYRSYLRWLAESDDT